ncbi:hypothetical protein [Bacillus sp. NEB1478]|uniref:hypothetical protein n=1 Tax=Bacillus sp. NEB1478 TaxID=3073816 RepID=UPI0028734137|nr:hypothetical protein [Bacillus sp. NEB1478]WNB91020.1 hypothetical protein RGB74_14045 [Bacillus sp. NEB1478]
MLRDFIDFMFDLFSNGNFTGLDTRRIDAHIDELKTYDWFNRLYHDEKYRKFFFTNVHVRKYLQSKRRVNKIIDNTKAREKFIIFLEKQSKKG